MGFRKVYKDGKEFVCLHTRQMNEMIEQGWTQTPQSAPKTSPKPKKKKAKVEADSDVKVDSTFNDGEPINIDQGTNTEE